MPWVFLLVTYSVRQILYIYKNRGTLRSTKEFSELQLKQ